MGNPARPSAHGRVRVRELEPGVERVTSSSSAEASLTRSATPSPSAYDAFDGPPALVVPGWVFGEHLDDQLGDAVELVVAEAAGGERGGAEPDAGGVPGAVRVGRAPSCGW